MKQRHGKTVQFGDLFLQFTSRYELRWDDVKSGARADVSFYHPIAPEGFSVLGSIGFGGHWDPNGIVPTLCVKAVNPAASKPPLVPPTDYSHIWSDHGSGASKDGSCWRPIPPAGYVALGDVFVAGYNKPNVNQVMCVATELVSEGNVGDEIWLDTGSGADMDFGAWQVQISSKYIDIKDGLFAVNSFVGAATHAKPGTSSVAWVLKLPMPTTESAEPEKPTLNSHTTPPDHTTPVVDRIVTVPFTAVLDNDKTTQWKLEHSPFYDIERSVYYDLLIFEDNKTEKDQTKAHIVTTGITKEQSESFSVTTGISVSYENGIEAGGFSTKCSIQLSIELGYTSTSSISVFESTEEDAELTIPAKHAAALWLEANSIRSFRSDDTPVSAGLSFKTGNTAYLSSQFPAPDQNSRKVRHKKIKRKLK